MAYYVDIEGLKFDYSGLAHIGPYEFQRTAKYFMDQVTSLPKADVFPAKYGRWEPCANKWLIFWHDKYIVKCAACGVKQNMREMLRDGKDASWCPHCGARMSESLYFAKVVGKSLADGIAAGLKGEKSDE